MNEKILVVEDEAAINDLLCMSLETSGYRTTAVFDGEACSRLLKENRDFALAVLDIMLPGKDGFALLPELREADIPVLFLTAKGDVCSKVKGLREGAEDYLVKPFEMLELLVRVEKILSRNAHTETALRIRNVEIYPERRVVKKDGVEVHLKPMEFDCLLLLAKHPNLAMTREQMLRQLWGVSFDGETRTIDVHIGRIRKKLGLEDVILTVPRIGYRLEVKP